MPKNIVVFADGTGQDGGSDRNTNVYKMFNMSENRTDRQTCYYDAGVGAGGLGRIGGLASGWGFGRNVRDCYSFIHSEFRAGDRIFLVGFSRGAATVRSLSYFIHLFGILPLHRERLVREAWGIYTIDDPEKRRREAEKFISYNHTMWTRIHFLGCYDTVAALGAPFAWASRMIDRLPGFKHRFHDLRLSPAVVHAYHALALDDERKTFHPLLWDPIEEEARHRAPTDGPLACETMRQVWFAGSHTDVGGGYRGHSLSDIPLVWMTQMAVDRGLRIYPAHGVPIAESPDGTMHDPRRGVPGRLYRRAPRRWDTERADRPIVHASALARRKGRENQDEPAYTSWMMEHTPTVEAWIRYEQQPWRAAPAPAPVPAPEPPVPATEIVIDPPVPPPPPRLP